MRAFVFSLLLVSQTPAADLKFKSSPGKIEILLDGQPFTEFHHDAKRDKPFLHPLRSASGEFVTRGLPVDPLPGDSSGHPWHRGLW